MLPRTKRTDAGHLRQVSVQVSIGVRFDAKVRKNHPGRQAGFLRKLWHFNGIGHLRGALREQEARGSNPRAPMMLKKNATIWWHFSFTTIRRWALLEMGVGSAALRPPQIPAPRLVPRDRRSRRISIECPAAPHSVAGFSLPGLLSWCHIRRAISSSCEWQGNRIQLTPIEQARRG
jgi:hypothetical protein